MDTFKVMIFKPVQFIKGMLLPVGKIYTILWTLLFFGGLSLLGLEILILSAPLWLGRLISFEPWRWSLIGHYSAAQAPILIVASIVGTGHVVRLLKNKVSKNTIISLATIILLTGTILVQSRIDNKNFDLFLEKDFYQIKQMEKSAWQAIRIIPPNASLAAQSAFPQVSGRKEIYNIPCDFNKTKPEYLLLADNLDRWPFKNDEEYTKFINFSQDKYNYKQIFSENGVHLLKLQN
jgi:uncharacterized membrane protein